MKEIKNKIYYDNKEARKVLNFTYSGMNRACLSGHIQLVQIKIGKKKNNNFYLKEDVDNYLIKITKRKNEVEQICNLYKSGMFPEKISEIMDIDLRRVYNVSARNKLFNKNDIRMSPTTHKNKNDSFFDKIDNEAAAYFVGLLLSDGCIKTEGNGVSLALTESDGYIVEKLSNLILGFNNVKIYNYKNGKLNVRPRAQLSIYSKRIKERLIEIGLTPKKSLTVEAPIDFIEPSVFHHFLRGLWDGDGCWTKQNVCYLIGSTKCCKQLQEHLNKLGYKCNYREAFNINQTLMGFIHFTAQEQTVKFGDWLYSDATIFLTRKKDKYLKIKAHVEHRLAKREKRQLSRSSSEVSSLDSVQIINGQ